MDKLENKKIAIIGIGHMGNSLMKGLVNRGFNKTDIILSNNSEDNKKAVAQADWIVISVKPLVVRQVLEEVKDMVKDKLILSVAAGISIDNIQRYVGNKNQKVIRLMPNIAVAINSGVIGLYSSNNITLDLVSQVKKVFSSLGTIIEVKKKEEIDNLMFISACGPGIVAYFMETLAKSGQKKGLSKNISNKAVLETVKGTLLYLQKNGVSFGELKNSVSTKGGITEEILKSMEKDQFEEIFAKGIQNGYFKLDKLKKEVDLVGNY